jgi:hypothetical protein
MYKGYVMPSYDDFIKEKMQEIENRILSKHNIKKRLNTSQIGIQPKRGRVGDKKAKLICDTFDLSRGTLKVWRNGSRGVHRQRLFCLLYSLDNEVYQELQNIIKG